MLLLDKSARRQLYYYTTQRFNGGKSPHKSDINEYGVVKYVFKYTMYTNGNFITALI